MHSIVRIVTIHVHASDHACCISLSEHENGDVLCKSRNSGIKTVTVMTLDCIGSAVSIRL